MSDDSVLEHLKAGEDEAIEFLTEAVGIKSVSADGACREEVFKMAEWIKRQVLAISGDSEVALVANAAGLEVFEGGEKKAYPPVVVGEVGLHDAEKKTLLIYAHYDVQPAEKSDGWETDPWVLTRVGDELRGRGSTDDKGPLLGWLLLFKAFFAAQRPLPVNVRFCFEGMEECGSVGFDETVAQHKLAHPAFWEGCDFCTVSDNYWLGLEKPCLTYGLKGLAACQLTVEGPQMDLHSGVFGGAVFQPLDDLLYVLSRLKRDEDETCLIPGIEEDVAPETPEERAMYEKLSFSTEALRKQIGVDRVRGEKVDLLMRRWRRPTLTVHGIEGAYSGPGCKTVIPRKVVGKFSLRLVPNHSVPKVAQCIQVYVDQLMAERTAQNLTCNKWHLEVEGGPWFYVNPLTSPVFKAAHQAIQQVWNCEPDYTREGGSIPVTVTLSKLTGKDLALIPMGRADDGAHSQNEKLDLSNYLKGIQVFYRFLQNLANL